MTLPVDLQVSGDGAPVVLVHSSASGNRQFLQTTPSPAAAA